MRHLRIRCRSRNHKRFPRLKFFPERLLQPEAGFCEDGRTKGPSPGFGWQPLLRAMLVVPDPVGAGLVASLARLSGNITGLSTLARETYAKRLGLLKEAFPGLRRVGVLVNTTPSYAKDAMRETTLAAQDMGIELHEFPLTDPDKLETLFASIVAEKPG